VWQSTPLSWLRLFLLTVSFIALALPLAISLFGE
jgi:hypothetical protein